MWVLKFLNLHVICIIFLLASVAHEVLHREIVLWLMFSKVVEWEMRWEMRQPAARL